MPGITESLSDFVLVNGGLDSNNIFPTTAISTESVNTGVSGEYIHPPPVYVQSEVDLRSAQMPSNLNQPFVQSDPTLTEPISSFFYGPQEATESQQTIQEGELEEEKLQEPVKG